MIGGGDPPHVTSSIWGPHPKGKQALRRKIVNPLSPKGDQHPISPCNINALQNRVVMRITDMMTQDEFAWYFITFSPLLLLEMNRGNKWEFKFWSWGLKG